jgi:glycosyltransferase involved in cell wall biosynthesis
LIKDDSIHSNFLGLEQYTTTLVHVQPEPFFQHAFEVSGLYPRAPKTYRIGYWYWEMDRIPASWDLSAVSTDELWAATTFVSEALKDRFKLPVFTLPPSVELSAFKQRSRECFGIPREKFAFVFAFNMMSIMERKNPLGLIRAFARAFTRNEPVVLILKTNFGDIYRTQIEELHRAAAQAFGEIVVIDENYSQDMMLSLIEACDAYISLHRSEGLGLTMAEAMLLGKPTIATRFSGNVDFMNDQNSLLVDYRLIPLGRSYPPYDDANMTWAEPSEEHAARLMRQLFDNRSFARKLGASGMVDLQRKLSVGTTGRKMRERLEAIMEEQKLS